MTRSIPVILNPASGPDQPVLKLLNRAFRAAEVDWEARLTMRAGDAGRLARELLDAGQPLVAVCGGDGTVEEVVAVLAGTPAALAILPSGTGNALAVELGLPLDLIQAVTLACHPEPPIRLIDVGRAGERVFALRVSMGLELDLVRLADRALKDQLGPLAYPVAALQTLGALTTVTYQLTIDGRALTAQGVQCTLANTAQTGVSGLALAQGVNVSDGLLDVIVLRDVDLPTLAALATSNLLRQDLGLDVQHWQGREITVAAEPAQAAAIGEEVITQTPVTARVWPGALRVVAPA